MAWITPKTNWIASDGVDSADFNRIEGNIKFIADNPTGTLLRLGEGSRNVAIGAVTTDSGPRLVVADGVGAVPALGSNVVALFQNNDTAGDDATVTILANDTGFSSIAWADGSNQQAGQIRYEHSLNVQDTYVGGAFVQRVTSAGHHLFDTTSDPGETLHVGSGGARFTGTSGYISFDTSSRIMLWTAAASNNIRLSNATGYLRIVTGGRGNTDSEANVLFNADQTTTFNDKVLIDITDQGSYNLQVSGFALIDQVYAQGSYNFINTTSPIIQGNQTTGQLTITAGLSSLDGFNMQLIGDTAATNPNGTIYRAGTTEIARMDNTGKATFNGGVVTDDVFERTGAAGITFNNDINVDTINEKTAANGVTIDGVVLKDSEIDADFGTFGPDGILVTGGVQTGNVKLSQVVRNIGAWNMDSTSSVGVTHGITQNSIRSIDVVILNDDSNVEHKLSRVDTSGNIGGGVFSISSTTISLVRTTGGIFDNTGFDDGAINRGYVIITYAE